MFESARVAGDARAGPIEALRASAGRIIVAVTGLAVCSTALAQSEHGFCLVKHPRGENGATIAAQMSVVNDGTPCVMSMRLGGHPATSLAIRSRPTGGTLSITESSVAYTPNPGYIGNDSFDVQWFGIGFGPNGKSHNVRTKVDVTVRAASDEPDAMGEVPEAETRPSGK